jgi:hypothetical protein
MSLPLNMTCKSCDRHMGIIISPPADRLAPLILEFACPECVEKVARSKQITLDSETRWGRLIAEIKGR